MSQACRLNSPHSSVFKSSFSRSLLSVFFFLFDLTRKSVAEAALTLEKIT